jgi:putative ABC transport system permease protein
MASLLNWLCQLSAVTRFGLISMPQRRGSSAAAAFGIAGVVAVLVGVMSIAVGFRRAMAASASPETAMVLRGGADNELVSGLGRQSTRIITDAPGVERNKAGPLASPELFVIITVPKISTGSDVNVPLRGVGPTAFDVRTHLSILQGRMFEWGRDEVIVGVGASREFAGLRLGDKLKVGQNLWSVVGVFSAGGGVADSEIWADAEVLRGAYHRGDVFQSVYVKLTSPEAFKEFKDALTSDPRLNVQVLRQSEFYAEQSDAVTKLVTTLGYLIAVLMAIGAVFGALNTMYTSVSARTREIATLRALGFGSGPVVAAIMLEAISLALFGGVLGAVLSFLLLNGAHTATMNMQSFSQMTFSLAVTPRLLAEGVIWATLIGACGGLLPAFRAARMPIADALRAL